MKSTKNKKFIRKKLVKELDIVWAKIIKSRGSCERCGNTKGLQAAHIFSRSNYSTRWALPNGVCLCGGCHIFWAHKNPVEFAEFVISRLQRDVYDDLKRKHHLMLKTNNEGLSLILDRLNKLKT